MCAKIFLNFFKMLSISDLEINYPFFFVVCPSINTKALMLIAAERDVQCQCVAAGRPQVWLFFFVVGERMWTVGAMMAVQRVKVKVRVRE